MNFFREWHTRLYWLVPFIAILLAIVQWAFNRSLGGDEAMLALNIISRDFKSLLQPLDDLQVAPILFLWVVKFCTFLIPDSELGLRLFPLLSFATTAFVFSSICFRCFQIRWVATIILALLFFNATIIFYSSEVKQYMSDIMCSSLLISALLHNNQDDWRQLRVLLIMGVTMVWVSNISPFILASAGIFLLLKTRPLSIKQVLPLAILFFGWVLSFAIYYSLFINGHPAKDGMQAFWQDAGAFAPGSIFSLAFLQFIFFKFHSIFQKLSPAGLFGLYILWFFFLLGIVQLFLQKKWAILGLILSPMMLHIVASMLKLYPFQSRLVFYLYPQILLCCGFGILLIAKAIPASFTKALSFVGWTVPVLMLILLVRQPFPMRYEETKESMDYIARHSEDTDSVYIYYGTAMAYRYYSFAGQVPFKLNEVWGSDRSSPEIYMNDLKGSTGRIWLLFSHVTNQEDKAVMNLLAERGLVPLKSYFTNGSSTLLYIFP